MTDTKHTPWKPEIDDLSGSLLVIDYGSATVAEVFDRKRMDIAHLIAAAPELLDALENTVQFAEASHRQCDDPLMREAIGRDILKARAAISKAKGESQ